MTNGFRVLTRRRAVAAETATAFLEVPVSTVSDSMSRLTAGGSRIRPMHAGGGLSGPAITVRTRPGDNLMVHLALDLAEPGDIVVVDAGGDLTNAIMGELMVLHATQRRLGGVIINGAIRDSAAIAVQSLPVFAAGITHRGPYKDGPGEINVPIAIDGMTIEPGDLVIGDADGVLAVPYDQTETVLAAARAKVLAEDKSAEHFRAGTSRREHIRERAIALGATFETD